MKTQPPTPSKKPPPSATYTPYGQSNGREPIGLLPPSVAALALANQPGAPPVPVKVAQPKKDKVSTKDAAIDVGLAMLAPVPMATLDTSPIGEAMADTVGIRPSAGVVLVTGALAMLPFVPSGMKVKALRFAEKTSAPVVGVGLGAAGGRKITKWWRGGSQPQPTAGASTPPATGGASPPAPTPTAV